MIRRSQALHAVFGFLKGRCSSVRHGVVHTYATPIAHLSDGNETNGSLGRWGTRSDLQLAMRLELFSPSRVGRIRFESSDADYLHF